MAAFDALQALAARQAAEGNPLQAIKCLEACLRLSLMPADEAQTRLRAARLLLLHTSNLAEARQHLQKAQMVVQKLPAHHILKCEVAALLGRAHKCLGEVDYQRGAYERGLDVCQRALSAGAGGADSATRAKLQRWACYFHVRAADALASQAAPPPPEPFEVEGVEVDVFNDQLQLQSIWLFRGPLDAEAVLFLESQRREQAARHAADAAAEEALRAARRAQREAQLQELLAWAQAGQQSFEGYVSQLKDAIARQRELLGTRLGSPNSAATTAESDRE